MSSRDGFEVADVDTRLLANPKVSRLARDIAASVDRSPLSAYAPAEEAASRSLAAMAIYVATVLTSWRQAESVSAFDAAPFWVPAGLITEAVEHLEEAGLLEDSHIPARVLDEWLGRALRGAHEEADQRPDPAPISAADAVLWTPGQDWSASDNRLVEGELAVELYRVDPQRFTAVIIDPDGHFRDVSLHDLRRPTPRTLTLALLESER